MQKNILFIVGFGISSSLVYTFFSRKKEREKREKEEERRKNKNYERYRKNYEESIQEQISFLQRRVTENSAKLTHLLATKKGNYLTEKQVGDKMKEEENEKYINDVMNRDERKDEEKEEKET